jgi:hypothetical protein
MGSWPQGDLRHDAVSDDPGFLHCSGAGSAAAVDHHRHNHSIIRRGYDRRCNDLMKDDPHNAGGGAGDQGLHGPAHNLTNIAAAGTTSIDDSAREVYCGSGRKDNDDDDGGDDDDDDDDGDDDDQIHDAAAAAGDHHQKCAWWALLPPGYRFHPTDEELVGYYLAGKIQRPESFAAQHPAIFPEVDLNKCEPWDLPGTDQYHLYLQYNAH